MGVMSTHTPLGSDQSEYGECWWGVIAFIAVGVGVSLGASSVEPMRLTVSWRQHV